MLLGSWSCCCCCPCCLCRRKQVISRLESTAIKRRPPIAAPTPMPALAPVESPPLSGEGGGGPEGDGVDVGINVGTTGSAVPGVYPGAGVAGGTKFSSQKTLLPLMVGRLANASSFEGPAYRTSVAEQCGVQLAKGSFTSSVELLSMTHPVQFVIPSRALFLFKFLHAWLMATHSCSWNFGGLCRQLGEAKEGSVHPATYVLPVVGSQHAFASPSDRQTLPNWQHGQTCIALLPHGTNRPFVSVFSA